MPKPLVVVGIVAVVVMAATTGTSFAGQKKRVVTAATATPTATATAAATATATATAAATATATAAAAAAAAAPAAAAVANPDCTLVVPPNPLSAAGLATPYVLSATNAANGQCHEADAATAAFVQATVVDPATGAVSVYNPLVLDKGATAGVAPVVPTLAAGSVVGIWFGFNGTNLTLKSNQGSLAAGKCVNGKGASIFGQFAACNASTFFAAANTAITAGKLAVPALGKGTDGNPCPTTRDFTMVDQDQSDNVTSSYLIVGGSSSQNTAANRAQLANATVQVNGSDNLLLVAFIDQAVQCTPFQAPDLADNNTPTTSLALNELQAAADQKTSVALVPPNDPMTQVNGASSKSKLNLYRAAVDQPAVQSTAGLAATYCQNLVTLQPARLQQDQLLTEKVTSPDPAAASNLFTFLANRLNGSFSNLGCQNLIKTGNPVTIQTANGVAVGATFAKPVAAKNGPAPRPVKTTVAGAPGVSNPKKY